MKKHVLFLLVAALVVSGCDRKPKTVKTAAATDVSNTEMVILSNGQMQFFDFETNTLMPLESETDSVISVVYDNDKLYYTVAKNDIQNLELKVIDLNETNPQPKLCADWQLTEYEVVGYVYGFDVSSMQFDANRENIYLIPADMESVNYDGTVVYNIATGKVGRVTAEEFFTTDRRGNKVPYDHFFFENGMFYYASPEGKVCVNDKIDFSVLFTDENQMNDREYFPVAVSPDEKQLAYSVGLYWGEEWGFYCIANSDGSKQTMLTDSDITGIEPGWLADGTLAYVSYRNEDGPCVKLIDPNGKASVIASHADRFYIKPFADAEKQIVKGQKSIEECDMALFDKGKLIFYNSKDDVFVPLETETDSVVNGAFDEFDFYYNVVIGGELYLKLVYMMDMTPTPHMITDWGLKLDDCVSETYGRIAPTFYFPDAFLMGIFHTFNWDYYGFGDVRFYDFATGEKTDGWPDEIASDEASDAEMQQFMEDYSKFNSEDNNYYYDNGSKVVCVSDKIDFNQYISDPDYASDPEFDLLSISPTRKSVAYVTYLEWGDLGHGPLCFASLDGKVQLAFGDTDAADLFYGWLDDGSLVYATDGGIYKVSPEGEVIMFTTASEFAVR